MASIHAKDKTGGKIDRREDILKTGVIVYSFTRFWKI